MRRLLPVFAGLLITGVFPNAALAEPVTISIEAEADTYVRSGAANTNEGGSAALQIQASGNNRVLVRFPQVAVDAAVGGGTLLSATLEMAISANGNNWGASGRTIDLHRVTVPWAEGNGSTGSGATWNCAVDSNIANSAKDCTGTAEWSMSGSGERPWESAATATQLIVSGQGGTVSFDVKADVESFASGTPNNGWIVRKTDEGASGSITFSSRETASKPVLVLVVEPPPGGNFPPVISGNPPFRVNEGSAYFFAPVASDADPGDILAFSVQNRPHWLDFDPETGALSGTPSAGDAGVYRNIVITVTDSENQSASLPAFDIAVTVTLTAAADTYVRSGADNTNEGGSLFLRLKESGDNRTLIRFSQLELQALLNGRAVIWAELETDIIHNGNNWGASGRTVDAHRMLQDWAEGNGKVAGANPSDRGDGPGATWNCAIDSDIANSARDCTGTAEWSMSGSGERPWEPVPTGTALIQNQQSGTVSWNVTADVQAFFDGPVANHGWLLRKTNEGQSGLVEFTSRESGNPPRLVLAVEAFDGENRPPVISGSPPVEVEQDGFYSFVPVASDPDPGDHLTFAILNKPAWASFSTATGHLSGIPGNDDVGIYAGIAISVSDQAGAAAGLAAFSIEVININDPPSISGIPENTVLQDVLYTFTPQALDPDLIHGDELLFGVENLPHWVLFDPFTGELSGVPGNDDVGVYADIVLSVTDLAGATAWLPAFAIEVLNVNDPPSVSGTPETSVLQDHHYSFVPSASDPDLMHGDVLTFSVLNGPAWASFDPATGQLAGVPGNGDAGVYGNIVIAVTDLAGASAQLPAFSIEVININDPPSIQGVPPGSVFQDGFYSFAPTAGDPDLIHGDMLEFSISNLPPWADFDPVTGELFGVPGNDDVGIHGGIVIAVTDLGGLGAQLAAFSIEVINVNDPPVIEGVPAITIHQDELYVFVPASFDPDAIHGDVLVFSIQNLPPWASFDPDTGTLAGIPGNADVGVYPNIVISASDLAGLSDDLPVFAITVLNVNDPPVIGGTPASHVETGNLYTFVPDATDPDLMHGDILAFSIQNKPSWASFDSVTGTLSGVPLFGALGVYGNIVITVADAAGIQVPLPAFSVEVTEGLPPDPELLAPPLDMTVAAILYEATNFLFTGPDPVQRGVEPDAIEPLRIVVLRGKVSGQDGSPVPGVRITIKDHPEYGYTLTRTDGMFDMAVNGGEILTVEYRKTGYLDVYRKTTSRNFPTDQVWQDYRVLPEVVMVPYDTVSSTISFTAPVETHRASVSSDFDGDRQPTVLFFGGTSASMRLPDGSTQPLGSLTVRITEVTIGPDGPKAMPAELPPASAYTWAAGFSVDEAVAAGATRVDFSRPVSFYLENFLDFPVGMPVPTGVYDEKLAAWQAIPSGKVIRVAGIDMNGRAEIDIDGDSLAENFTALEALGFSEEELLEIASLYSVGQSLWRVRLDHFSAIDCNLRPGGPPPDGPPGPNGPVCEGPCCFGGGGGGGGGPPGGGGSGGVGCLIHNQRQSFGEEIAVTGTGYRLHYQTERVPGYADSRTAKIPLTSPTPPPGLQGVILIAQVAGREFVHSFAPDPGQFYNFIWDGKDAYGRTVQGSVPVNIFVGYAYSLNYQCADEFGSTRATPPACPSGIVASRGILQDTYWYVSSDWVTNFDIRELGLGGWSLNAHHFYEPVRGRIYYGDGIWMGAPQVLIDTAAGGGTVLVNKTSWNGMPARQLRITDGSLWSVLPAPQGGFYFSAAAAVWWVDPEGIIHNIAGGNCGSGYSGDGGPAVNACFHTVTDMDIGPDGSLYLADYGNHRVRRVWPDGTVTLVAGTGAGGSCGNTYLPSQEGAPAVSTPVSCPVSVAVAEDGVLYIASQGTRRIWRVMVDGSIETYAGGGSTNLALPGSPTGPIPSNQVNLAGMNGMAYGPDGSLYVADGPVVLKAVPDGRVSRVAGTGSIGFLGDGGPALLARLNSPRGLHVTGNGTIYIADSSNRRLRIVTPDGLINTYAGSLNPATLPGDGGPAGIAGLGSIRDVSAGPDGSVYMADFNTGRIRTVTPTFERYSGDAIVHSGGGNLYRFDYSGRHLETRDTRTGALLYEFVYDGDGLLSAIADRDGLVTTIERDMTGRPLAIVSPTGQRTELETWPTGELRSVTNPAGESHEMEYGTGGLMTGFRTPRGHGYAYAFDAEGRLVEERNPAGGGWDISRTETRTSRQVTMTSLEGRTSVYLSDSTTHAQLFVDDTLPWGGLYRRVFGRDGTVRFEMPDGTVQTNTLAGDPRFRLQDPYAGQMVIVLPSGLTQTVTSSVSAVLSDPNDPLSLVSENASLSVNGRTTASAFVAATRTDTVTSPAGRVQITVLDEKSRVASQQYGNLAPMNYTYDGRGRLALLTEGTGIEARTTSYGYDSHDRLAQFTDPEFRTVEYEYDAAGRIVRETLPDGREVIYGYDADGNLALIQPPGRPPHLFSYTPLNQTEEYAPPAIGLPEVRTLYEYNRDRELVRITRPDGAEITYTYNGGGQLVQMAAPHGAYTYSYHAGTGQLVGITAPATGGSGTEALAFSWNGGLPVSSSWAGTISGSVAWTYDNSLRVTGETVNGGSGITFAYDNDNLLTQAGSLSISRDSQNGLVTGTAIGAVWTDHAYNAFGEPLSLDAGHGGSTYFSQSYERDKLGRIVRKTETTNGVTREYAYTYDPAGRLTGVDMDGQFHSHHGYDANGNRLSRTDAAATVTTGVYDDQDRMLQYGDFVYDYSANGELIRATNTATLEVTEYGYDVFGNLRSVLLPDGTLIEYVIDGLHRRVGRKVNGFAVQRYLYSGQLRIAAELDGSGNVVTRFAYGERENVPEYFVRGGQVYRIFHDHLGSPRLVIDVSTGAIVQEMDYDEFGNVILDTNPGFQPFGFAGCLYDLDTRLCRFGARDYDAYTGRWTSKDPIGFDGGDLNLYGYVMADPVNGVDFYGEERDPRVPSKPGKDYKTPKLPTKLTPPGCKDCEIQVTIRADVDIKWKHLTQSRISVYEGSISISCKVDFLP